MKLHSLLPVLLLLTGCAYLHSTTTRSTDKNGVVTESTVATGYALFDANSSLMKFRNQSGNSSPTNYAPGTFVAGLNEQASSSNVVAIINALANVAGAASAAAK